MTRADTAALRVMLVDESPARRALLEQALRDSGYLVAASVDVQDDLSARIAEVRPDVIIIDMALPDRDTLESLRTLSRDRPHPVVLFAERTNPEITARAIRAGVSAYVVDGLEPGRIRPIVDIAVARFREFQTLRRELESTQARLAERKTIERAKGILMQRSGLSEPEAYGAMRKLAMARNKRLIDIAEALIASHDLLK